MVNATVRQLGPPTISCWYKVSLTSSVKLQIESTMNVHANLLKAHILGSAAASQPRMEDKYDGIPLLSNGVSTSNIICSVHFIQFAHFF